MAENITFSADALVQTLQPFNDKKEQDAEFFIQQFEDLFEAIKAPDNLKLILLKTKIGGGARQIIINSPEMRNEKNYENFKRKFIDYFKTEKSFAEAQNTFTNLKQNPTQKVEDFAKQFSIVAYKYLMNSGHEQKEGAKELLDTIKLTRFLEALRPDIAFEIHKAGPTSFDEAVRLGKRVEIALSNIKEINTASHKNEPIYTALVEFSKEQNEQIKELKEKINSLQISKKRQQVESNEERVFCHICKRNNHSTQKCWFNKKNENREIRQQPRSQNQPQWNKPNYKNNRNFNKPFYYAAKNQDFIQDFQQQNHQKQSMGPPQFYIPQGIPQINYHAQPSNFYGPYDNNQPNMNQYANAQNPQNSYERPYMYVPQHPINVQKRTENNVQPETTFPKENRQQWENQGYKHNYYPKQNLN